MSHLHQHCHLRPGYALNVPVDPDNAGLYCKAQLLWSLQAVPELPSRAAAACVVCYVVLFCMAKQQPLTTEVYLPYRAHVVMQPEFSHSRGQSLCGGLLEMQ